ncbi:zf-TFIIB domain-containing protein [Marinobacter lacisalsi]|uniref:Zf-TFIIB domain-containing protein n=1 Tax=Marinobacter lacisalsi TaxID=475979 RepID=A0ABV8QE51_9GAMM
MKCPRTGSPLRPLKVGGITVDVSKACGGVFFDNFELEKFDESTELRGEVLAEHLEQFSVPLLVQNERINCPKCVTTVMRRYYYSPENQIEIDECVTCNGIWLDAGELEHLRRLFPTQAKRQQVGRDFVEAKFNSPEYRDYQREQQESTDRINHVTDVLWSVLGVRRRR